MWSRHCCTKVLQNSVKVSQRNVLLAQVLHPRYTQGISIALKIWQHFTTPHHLEPINISSANHNEEQTAYIQQWRWKCVPVMTTNFCTAPPPTTLIPCVNVLQMKILINIYVYLLHIMSNNSFTTAMWKSYSRWKTSRKKHGLYQKLWIVKSSRTALS